MIPREIQFLLQQCKSINHFLQFQSLIIKSGLDRNEFLISKLILSSFPVSLNFARLVFDYSPITPQLFSWNTLIKEYSKSSNPIESINLFCRLQRIGLRPDNFTFPFVLKASGQCSLVQVGGALHSLILKVGLDCDLYIRNTLLTFYSNCNAIELARQVFDEMSYRDVVSWTSVIAGYVACDKPLDAWNVFQEMNRANENPNYVTLVSVISACTSLLNIRLGESTHSHIIVSNTQLNVPLGTAIIDMYAKCGYINKALKVFHSSMKEKNLQCWTVMIAALADNSIGKEAIFMFDEMEKSGSQPDSVAFSAILSACSHLGLVTEGQNYFNRMVNVYKIKPSIEHFGCMVDMLGRAGMIEEAYEIIKCMPMKPNSVILRSFVSSCKHHGNLACLDENVKNLLVQIEPDLGANYILASNVSSMMGLWSEVGNLRKTMKGKGLKKVLGFSRLED